jgi:hypothetical protein
MNQKKKTTQIYEIEKGLNDFSDFKEIFDLDPLLKIKGQFNLFPIETGSQDLKTNYLLLKLKTFDTEAFREWEKSYSRLLCMERSRENGVS